MDFDYVLNNCHWIEKVGELRYEYNMYLDHHSLSTFRSCEQLFVHQHIEGWTAKAGLVKMPWFFAIGIALHDALEWMYNRKQENQFEMQAYIQECANVWTRRNMEAYVGEKEYNALGGITGFCGMLTQYAIFYNEDTERLRIIGTEINFGKGKEVFLGYINVPDVTTARWIRVNCYLAGRIDFLMDNGRTVGPMDHKSSGYIDGDPISKYNPQDGMTGYIFATQQIIKKNFPEIAAQRNLNMMWMNFLGIAHTSDSNKRFKRLPLFKTDWQLEEYRLRNLTTFEHIFNMIYNNKPPQWNTNSCSNMYRRDCQFKGAHQQNTANDVFTILSASFERRPVWNPDMSHQQTEGKE